MESMLLSVHLCFFVVFATSIFSVLMLYSRGSPEQEYQRNRKYKYCTAAVHKPAKPSNACENGYVDNSRICTCQFIVHCLFLLFTAHFRKSYYHEQCGDYEKRVFIFTEQPSKPPYNTAYYNRHTVSPIRTLSFLSLGSSQHIPCLEG